MIFRISKSIYCLTESKTSMNKELKEIQSQLKPFNLTNPQFHPPISNKELDRDITMQEWTDKIVDKKKLPIINMTINNNPRMIENEFRRKFAYDDLLSDLLTFIYFRFLTSNEKYAQEGYITHVQTSRHILYEIKQFFYEELKLEYNKAYVKGFSLVCDNEQQALDLLRQANAVLYLELLEYVKSKGLSILSFLRLVKVKLERNDSSHCILVPSISESKEQNLLNISQMLVANKIEQSTIETHPLYNANYYSELIGCLNSLA